MSTALLQRLPNISSSFDAITPFAPLAPDFSICDRRYGSRLTPLLCGRAANILTEGDSPFLYPVHSGQGSQSLPQAVEFGNCQIWVEVAGPATPEAYEAIPNEIRGMAAWVIQECVSGNRGGFGGFTTKDINKLTEYVTKPDTNVEGTYPRQSAFLTVTVTAPWYRPLGSPSPGNFDPSIAQHLADTELAAWSEAPPGSELRYDLAKRANFFTRQSTRMHTGGNIFAWWGSTRRKADLNSQ